MFLQLFISRSGIRLFFMFAYKRYPSVKQAAKEWDGFAGTTVGKTIQSLLPSLPILPYRHPLCLFEHFAEVIHIPNPAFLADFFGGLIGEAQKVFGFGDAGIQQVVSDGDAEVRFEDPGQVKFIDEVTLGKLVQRYFLFVVFVQVLLDA